IEASGAQVPTLEQLVLADMISSGAYDRHVRRCRLAYRSRRDRLVAALPPRFTPQGISAGLHLVLPLSTEDEQTVPAIATRHSLAITTLTDYRMTPTGPSGLNVGYGSPTRTSFGGTLDALLKLLADLEGQRP
ncbi:PLP-dependent aminotransferase family protein, partial [Kibdelosporangium lantanae]